MGKTTRATKSEEEKIVEKAVQIITAVLEKERNLIENFLNMLSGREAQVSFKMDNVKLQLGKTAIVISGESSLSVKASKKTKK